jgi:hypothetical protein
LLLTASPSAAADPTVQQLIDAIYTDTYDPALDLNGDGAVDIADIVCLHNNCHKDAWFANVEQVIDEGWADAQVRLEFAHSFENVSVHYSIKGTATPGEDFTDPGGTIIVNGDHADLTIIVNGDHADLVIPIINDTELDEEIETIVITLDAGPGYRVSGPSSHTISITDNDASWYGVLETAEGRVAIRMTLIDDGTSGATCALVSDGMGTLPEGDYSKACALTYAGDIDGDGVDDLVQFDVDFDPIAMPATSNSFGVTLDRSFSFQVDASAFCDPSGTPCLDDGQCPGEEPCVANLAGHVAGDTILSGDFTETAYYPGHAHLFRQAHGTFTLQRQSSRPTSIEVEMYAGECSPGGTPCNDVDDCNGDPCILP